MRRRHPDGPVVRSDDGLVHLNLAASERTALVGLFNQLEQLITSDPDDPRVRRLYPTAYHQDPDHESEYRSFMTHELLASRQLAIARARDLVDSGTVIGQDEAMSFMTVLNSLRLVLGTILDVDEGDETDPDPGDPNFDYWQLYGYLGWLLEWTVEALEAP